MRAISPHFFGQNPGVHLCIQNLLHYQRFLPDAFLPRYKHAMHFRSRQVTADSPRTKLCRQPGFTLVELVTIIIILGVLAAIAAPRFFERNTFDSRSFQDQVIATLRYAQKAAIAQHRFVCVAFTANTLVLTTGATAACDTPLTSPAGQPDYLITAPDGITFNPLPANFNFDALGRASAAQTIAIIGAINPITVEAETGHVHTP